MERRNDIVKLSAKNLSQKLNIDLLNAASQVTFWAMFYVQAIYTHVSKEGLLYLKLITFCFYAIA